MKREKEVQSRAVHRKYGSEMKITLPLPPNIGNGRMHWRVKLNRKKTYFETCDMVATVGYRRLLNVSELWTAPPRARIKATFYCGGRNDIDNLFARAKWPVDWLVKNGYLKGDSEKHLVWEMPVQVVKRNQQYRIEFEISEAA